jgi:hypothetical protein
MTRARTIRIERRLDQAEYDRLVEDWNQSGRDERIVRAGRCLDLGHRWSLAPISADSEPVKVCVRCCRYWCGQARPSTTRPTRAVNRGRRRNA